MRRNIDCFIGACTKTVAAPHPSDPPDMAAIVARSRRPDGISATPSPWPRRRRETRPDPRGLLWPYNPDFEAMRWDARRDSVSDHDRPWVLGSAS